MDVLQAEVRVLEAEVKALKRALEELPAPSEDTAQVQFLLESTFSPFIQDAEPFVRLGKQLREKSFQEIYQSDSEGCETSKDLRSNLGNLESELLFLNMFTGINISKYSKKTENLMSTEMTERRIKKVLERHKLSGNCHIITFQVEFQILEVQNKDSLSSVITDLNIIMESTAYSELSEFVSRAEERRDLYMFFRSLRFFVEWCEYRKRTFKHFKEKYPAAVQLPEGPSSSCMHIRSASQPGFELVIVWQMHIDEEGQVLPKLDLLTQVPQRALELDQEGAVAAAPHSFRALLGTLGIEAALESLLRLLCAAGSPPPTQQPRGRAVTE